MEILQTVKELVEARANLKVKGLKIGFVPTMGALHDGHLSLVKKSVEDNDITIASVFVNPKQFNEKSDFENYPVDYDADIKLLESVNCNYIFMPNSEDVYGAYSGIFVEFDGLDNVFEGEFRPRHFQGVVDVVYRLFDLVKPDNAYFGQKDFQQLAVIKKLVKFKNLEINIVGCPIVREKNGLAMSSRNERLSPNQLRVASVIYNLMDIIAHKMELGDLTEKYSEYFMTEIQKMPEMRSEYCVFCHPDTLDEIKKVKKNSVIVMCVAVWLAKVRLIDNFILEF